MEGGEASPIKIHRRNLKRTMIIILLVVLFSLPQIIFAFTAPFPCPKGSKCASAAATTSSTITIKQVLNWIIGVALTLSILFIVIGEFFILNASGNEEAKEKGIGMVNNTIVGIVIIVISYVLISIVLKIINRAPVNP
jgi:hypothetical protein